MKTEEELPAEAEVVAYLAAVQKVWNGASPELRAEYVAAIESGKFIIPPGKPMMREQLSFRDGCKLLPPAFAA